MNNTVAEMDVRVGGKRLICMASPDGSMKMWSTGEMWKLSLMGGGPFDGDRVYWAQRLMRDPLKPVQVVKLLNLF